MRSPCPLRSLVFVACLAAAGVAQAQDNAGGETRIYQQRDANGRIVLTDRPIPGAVTQRTWQSTPEDAAAAARRREQARLDAQATSERIQRQLDAERQRDLELSLARARLAAAERTAQAEAAARPVTVYPYGDGAGYTPIYSPGYGAGWPPVTTPGVKPGFPQRPALRPSPPANPLPLWRRPLVPPEPTGPGASPG